MAVSFGHDLVLGGASRATRVFARRGGRWVLVHQHLSAI
ncbi:nuclear transport factor 2 family protein [Herbidospora mongoliensis]|nr:nuclear transport factor 2 family protein [Herbidospora mongoliensis]